MSQVMKFFSIRTGSPKPSGSPMRPFTVKKDSLHSFNQTATNPLKCFCQTIETALFDFSGTDHRDDDVTIVVIKAKDEKESLREIDNQTSHLS